MVIFVMMSEFLQVHQEGAAQRPPESRIEKKVYKPARVDEKSKEEQLPDLDTVYDQEGNQKEVQETLPKLEEKNYKIDIGMSLEEKLQRGWSKEKQYAYVHGVEKIATVIRKKIEGPLDDAFVREYLSGVPEQFKGEQLFNWNAVCNLGLQDRLPSYEQLEKIMGGQENHQKFLKNNNILFSGYLNRSNTSFYGIGQRSEMLLSDSDNGIVAEIQKDHIEKSDYFALGSLSRLWFSSYGFSVRLLQKD